jgi:hypothetical protein
MNRIAQATPDVLLVGAGALAAEIGVPERQLFYWLTKGRIKSASKIGSLWTAPRNALRRELGLDCGFRSLD